MNSTTSRFRFLTDQETALVAGGDAGGDETGPDILVTAKRYNEIAWDWGFGGGTGSYGYGNGYGLFEGGGGFVGNIDSPPSPPDDEQIEVVLVFDRPLTAAEQHAVDDLQHSIEKQTATINALSDNATIVLKDGSTVTGAELKAIWANTDFIINDQGHKYPNGTDRGSADYGNGNPVVSFNIDNLVKYDSVAGGTDYLVGHELGHMTTAGRASNAAIYADLLVTAAENDSNEQLANDIARAIVIAGHGTVMANPGSGYSAGVVTFSTPAPSGGGDTGSGGDTSYDPGGYVHDTNGGHWEAPHLNP